MSAKGYPSAPSTRDINAAALSNFVVMIPMAGIPSFSTAIASCKLHDEQLPQSPIPVKARSQRSAAAMISLSAGAL